MFNKQQIILLSVLKELIISIPVIIRQNFQITAISQVEGLLTEDIPTFFYDTTIPNENSPQMPTATELNNNNWQSIMDFTGLIANYFRVGVQRDGVWYFSNTYTFLIMSPINYYISPIDGSTGGHLTGELPTGYISPLLGDQYGLTGSFITGEIPTGLYSGKNIQAEISYDLGIKYSKKISSELTGDLILKYSKLIKTEVTMDIIPVERVVVIACPVASEIKNTLLIMNELINKNVIPIGEVIISSEIKNETKNKSVIIKESKILQGGG